MNTNVAKISPKDVVLRSIVSMKGKFKEALPPDVNVDQFTRVILTALQQKPDLMLVEDKQSLYNSCVQAAQEGLMPNGKEGAIVPYGKGTRWMPMVYGIIKNAARYKITITAHVVKERDTKFEYALGDNEEIIHIPAPFGTDRGKTIGAYAIATLEDGKKIREVIDMQELEKIRKFSKNSETGPWKDWTDEMHEKSAIHRLDKRLPKDSSKMPLLTSTIKSMENEFDLLSDTDTTPPPEQDKVVSGTVVHGTAASTKDKIMAASSERSETKQDDMQDGDLI